MRESSSKWYAADLERYNSEYRVNLLSAHKGIMNFRVEKWPHLLMVAKAGFERGPCTIGLDGNLLIELKEKTETATEIRFNSHDLTFCSGYDRYLINWRAGERLSFAPYKISILDHNKALSAIKQYLNALGKLDLSTPGAVLFGMDGGSEYFRLEIKNHFPSIVSSLLLKNEQEFIYNCRKLIGMGHGSSPSGDDLICGALLAYHHLVADQLFIDKISTELEIEAGKTSLMGGHMLEMGRSGFTPEMFKALVSSISKGSFEPDLLARAAQIGASTGIELMIALIAFTENYLDIQKKGSTI